MKICSGQRHHMKVSKKQTTNNNNNKQSQFHAPPFSHACEQTAVILMRR